MNFEVRFRAVQRHFRQRGIAWLASFPLFRGIFFFVRSTSFHRESDRVSEKFSALRRTSVLLVDERTCLCDTYMTQTYITDEEERMLERRKDSRKNQKHPHRVIAMYV